MKTALLFYSLLFCIHAVAQDRINQLDANGERHGLWRKTFEEAPSQVRYEGTFEHGKEVGIFKFYILGQENPAAIKTYTQDTDTAEVKYLSQKGNVISEGKMLGEKRIGEWKYYHLNSDKLMMTERYEDGVLQGEKVIYFENGVPTEKSSYVNGQLHGKQDIFSEKGVLLKTFTYRNGELHGPSKVYNGKGELLIEGEYRNDKHFGIWKYYENGNLKEQKNFSDKN